MRIPGHPETAAGDDPAAPGGDETVPGASIFHNGMLNLAWQAEHHPEWPAVVEAEIESIRSGIRAAHNTPLRFVFWCAPSAATADKAAFQSAGMLRRGPRLYLLDSTEPAKLRAVLEDIERRCSLPITSVLRSTLVAGVCEGGCSPEAVMNLEKIAHLYERYNVNPVPNFVYMAPDGSDLEGLGRSRGWRRVPLRLDNADTVPARHMAPLTRASLYPLALAKCDLEAWIRDACLGEEQVHVAWRLAAFLRAQADAGRNKLTLLLPKLWSAAAQWTKIVMEESFSQEAARSMRVVLAARPKLANYRSPRDPAQDRVFLAVQVKGLEGPDPQKIAALRRAGYPIAVAVFPRGTTLARYMQFVHYAVFGMAWLGGTGFGCGPQASTWAAATACLYRRALQAGSIERTPEWRSLTAHGRRLTHEGLVTLHLDSASAERVAGGTPAPEAYAALLDRLVSERRIDSADLAFFGDTRYSGPGIALRKLLERTAEKLFRARLKMPADVIEMPGMPLAAGGRCPFPTLIASRTLEQFPDARYSADHHAASFLAARALLEQNRQPFAAVTLKSMEADSLAALGDFLHRAAVCLKTRI